MLSRHAEDLFWAGRYMERAEDTARLLDVTYHGLLESSPYQAGRAWAEVLAVLRLDRTFAERHQAVSGLSVSEFLVRDEENPGSIVAAVGRARDNLRSVREQVSAELWEEVNTFHLELRARDLRVDLEQQPYALYGMVKRRCQTLAGVASETMARDDGWRFLQIGWMLERAEMTCRLLDIRYAQSDEETGGDGFHHWVGTLKSASALEAYRKAYRSSMDPADVVDFLLLSRVFPRSVLFCLLRAEADLSRLGSPDGRLTRPERLLGRIRADLEFRDVHEVMAGGLHRFLDQLQQGVRQVAEAVALQYFRSSAEVFLHALEFHPSGAVAMRAAL